MIVSFPGFPQYIGEEAFEFPDPMEMLREPILGFAPADWVRTNGSEFQRFILDRAPLRHDTKYVLMSTQLRVTRPGLLVNPIEFPDLGSTRNEWHVDFVHDNVGRVHAVANVFGTEFNEKPIALEIPDDSKLSYRWFCAQAARNEETWGLRGRLAPHRRFVTFDRHIHRAPVPDRTTLRYFLRIAEVNEMMNPSDHYVAPGSVIFRGRVPVTSIEQSPQSVTIHFP